VDGVGQERDAARNEDNGELQRGGDREDYEGPFDRSDATLGRGDGRINHTMCMAMLSTVSVVIVAVSMTVSIVFSLGKAQPD
jgi:hypothetical protein